jgi:hypothetical protein
MKLLLDECVPRRFKSSLSTEEHQCVTAPEAGFAGKTNGELLGLAETVLMFSLRSTRALPTRRI